MEWQGGENRRKSRSTISKKTENHETLVNTGFAGLEEKSSTDFLKEKLGKIAVLR